MNIHIFYVIKFAVFLLSGFNCPSLLNKHSSVIRANLIYFLFTHDPVPVITAGEIEDILLVAAVRKVVGFDLDGELLHERARVAGLGVRIGVPCFLLGDQRRFGQEALEPARQVTAHMIDFVCVLPVATRTVAVRLVLDYLHTATGTLALLPRFFLCELHKMNGY